MSSALRRTAAHVFVDSIAAPALADADRHHLLRVLRLRAGEVVSVTDGDGRWRLCRIDADGGLVPMSDIASAPPPRPLLTVGFALPKGDRPEWIVQKLTEIGIDRIVVLTAERSVVRWDQDRAERQMARLRSVAREAGMQSRRVRLPQIDGPVAIGAMASPHVAVAEPGGAPLSLDVPTVMIGPEGGWSDAELAQFPARVGLGASILRVETAALVAAAQLSALREAVATR